MFLTKSYFLQVQATISRDLLTAYVQNFWSDVFQQINSCNSVHLLLMCKVQFTDSDFNDNEFRSIADLRKVNFKDKELFIQYLLDRIGILSDSYTVSPIKKIVFSYVVKDGLADDTRMLLHPEVYEVKKYAIIIISYL